MSLERKTFLDIRTILARRKFLLGAGASTAIATVSAPLLLRPRARLTSAALDETLLPEDTGPTFTPDARALSLRETHRETQLWHENTIVVFGADTQFQNSTFETPVFQTFEAVTNVRRRNPTSKIISALRKDPVAGFLPVTKETLLETKELILSSIRESRGKPLTLILSAHGGPSGIQLGEYVDLTSKQILPIFITAKELAGAYAMRYRGMRARLNARQSPDILALVNCHSGTLADEFITDLKQKEIEQEPRRVLFAFKPTAPITFSASTGSENSYINQMLFAMTECATVGDMYPFAEFVGGMQHSNPGIRVPDPRTGEAIIVGSTDSESRFA